MSALEDALRAIVRGEVEAVLADHLDGAAPRLERLLTAEHAGEILDCSPNLVWQLAGRGELDKVQVARQSPRVTAASVARLIAERRVTPAAARRSWPTSDRSRVPGSK